MLSTSRSTDFAEPSEHYLWVQWKTRGQRYRELRRLKVSERSASAAIFSPKGPWRLSFSEALHRAFTNSRFRRLGLPSMEHLVDA